MCSLFCYPKLAQNSKQRGKEAEVNQTTWRSENCKLGHTQASGDGQK